MTLASFRRRRGPAGSLLAFCISALCRFVALAMPSTGTEEQAWYTGWRTKAGDPGQSKVKTVKRLECVWKCWPL